MAIATANHIDGAPERTADCSEPDHQQPRHFITFAPIVPLPVKGFIDFVPRRAVAQVR
jgi:hypothetical protein